MVKQNVYVQGIKQPSFYMSALCMREAKCFYAIYVFLYFLNLNITIGKLEMEM